MKPVDSRGISIRVKLPKNDSLPVVTRVNHLNTIHGAAGETY